MIKKTIRYTVTADLIGWECYYALHDQIGDNLRMWVEDGLIVMEYDTPISFDEILEKNS
jgi:hypothetical protein